MKLNFNGFEIEGSVEEMKLFVNNTNSKVKIIRVPILNDMPNPNELSKNLFNYINNLKINTIIRHQDFVMAYGKNNGTLSSIINNLIKNKNIVKVGSGKYMVVSYVDVNGFYRKRVSKEHKRWTIEDKSLLNKLLQSGKSLEEIGKIFERSPNAIYMQKHKLINSKKMFSETGYLKSSYYKESDLQ